MLGNVDLMIEPKIVEFLSKTNRILIYEDTIRQLVEIEQKFNRPEYMQAEVDIMFSVDV